ncbi:hypothetical protein FHW18_004044 [Pigmentiphaga litoralis]|uniref:Sel1 repeat family protein n=1 Tax=Pigmentiphaga litoralis TaxID=516702 RepID=A0A7Y9IYH3_9BURK|nr:hypothetical protein [Pigmentiphaga litoralis]NYE84773.1 hypothetical protein [Pigmentiphaga litoralis]
MPPVTPKDINAVTPEELAQILAGPPERAAAWLHAAAEGGITQAQLVYGQMLLDGRGVDRDPEQAVFWFKRAARKDDPMAMNLLGQCYQHGRGVAPNDVMAAYWHRLAAQAGLDWGMYNYATALALGAGVDADRKEAFAWLSKAAALGHAKSINIVGGFYEDGWEVDVDLDTALDHYLRAAEGGDFRGQFNAARLLADRGRMDDAIRWLRRVPDTATLAFKEKTRDFLQQSPHPEFQALSGWFESRMLRAASAVSAGSAGSPSNAGDASAMGVDSGNASKTGSAGSSAKIAGSTDDAGFAADNARPVGSSSNNIGTAPSGASDA